MRRGILSAVVAVVALVLSACAGLPTSGPVNPGLPADEDAGIARLPVPPRRAAARRDARADRRGLHPRRIRPRPGGELGASPGCSSRPRSARRGSPRRASRSTCRTTVCPSRRARARSTLSLVAVATVDRERRVPAPTRAPRRCSFRLAQQDRRRVADHRGAGRRRARSRRLPERVPPLLAHVLRPDLAVPRARRAVVPDDERGDAHRGCPRRRSRRAAGSRTRCATPSPRACRWPARRCRSSRASPQVDAQRGGARWSNPTTLDRMQTQLEASLATAGVSGAQMSVAVDTARRGAGLDPLDAGDRASARAHRGGLRLPRRRRARPRSRDCPRR